MTAAPHQMPLPGIEAVSITPTWPQRGTLAAKALDAMLDGEWLDHESFMRHTGSWRLAAVICTLRALGWPVQSLPIATANAEHEPRTIALYSLSAKDLAQAFANGSGGAA